MQKYFVCRQYKLPLGAKTYVMGILNVTPDSFSDGGKFNQVELAVLRAKEMVLQGADMIDVGGESTRPGFMPVSAEEEMIRVIPVIKKLVREVDVPISIDTTKPKVAREALEAGVHIVNDIWGLHKNLELAQLAAEYKAGVVLMHNSDTTEYTDIMQDMADFLNRSIEIAKQAGIADEYISIDPGIGFGKTLEQNLEVMNRLYQLKTFGKPILLGTSKKSLIGKTLNLPLDQRVEGTAATVTLGIAYGADIIRVHDIQEMYRVAKMTDAMVRISQNISFG